MKKSLFFLLLLTSCDTCPEKVPPFSLETFTGREERVEGALPVRRPVYRAKVPTGWKRREPEGSIEDTTLSNVTFQIDEGVHLYVHTFPSQSLEERIPPQAQIARWVRQIGEQPHQVTPVGHGGFAGLEIESAGVLARSLQLDLEHYQTLSFLASTREEEEHYKQMRADYTIKVVGPYAAHRAEIDLFANSFELIQELPAR